ncbi:MAG: glycosyltransferase family 39 protein [Anaerolineae bacterium]|nr:glycosyltransferase family 39 protein [Anaerolineae bacterium]
MNEKRGRALLIVLLLILIVPSHLIGIDRATTIDEPWWVISGSNYYYALTNRDFANTIYDYHPAVTTTWMVTTGMVTYFPEYRGFGQGYFDVRKPHFEEFLRENGKDALDLLRYSRWAQSALILALAALGFFLLQMVMDYRMAFLSISLAMTAPFYLGHSRLLNHEGMLAIFVIVSLIGMYVYLEKRKSLIFLLISGVTFGLAQLTKSTSIALIGLVGLMLLVSLFKRDEKKLSAKILEALKTIGIWLVSAALVYFILWPGMWVAPGKMLSGVYGNAFSYAFQGARLDVTEELEPATFDLVTRSDGLLLYLKYWASGTTFVTWLGMAFALFAAFSKKVDWGIRSLLIYLLILGSGFILMFSIAQGRNAPHYIMTSFVSFDVIAGIGWGWALLWVQSRWQRLASLTISVVALTVLTLAQIGFGLPYAPYYFTYKNPLAREAATFGYGEGLAQASDYLAGKPNPKEIRAYVYNGMGTFSFYFPGETVVLKRAHLVEDDFATITEELRKADYLVLYPITRAKHPETEKILGELEGVVMPEKVITINGLEYIQIYRVEDIPESVYEALLAKHKD